MLRLQRPVATGTGLLALLVTLACGDAPTSIDNGGDSTDNRPVADAPALPIPSSPTADVPVSSDTLAKIVMLASNFRPVVDSAFGDWTLGYRRCALDFSVIPYQVLCSTWSYGTAQQRWSSHLPAFVDGINAVFMHFPVPAGRVLLIENGQHVVSRDTHWSDSVPLDPITWYERERTLIDAGLSDTVYVRRDRFWERKILEGGAGEYLLLIGDTEGSISTTYTHGTSITETEAFGETVSVSGGLSLGLLSANVSSTLSQSFTTSVSITEARTETFTKTVHGTAGKTVRFMVWELVECYTMSNENGDPFTDPNFAVRPDTLYRRGVATALQATEF